MLLSADGRACLSDLGLAQALGAGVRTAAGFSRLYAAPEQLMGQRCGLPADVYSFGLLLVSLLTRRLMRERGSWRLPRAPEECPPVRGRRPGCALTPAGARMCSSCPACATRSLPSSTRYAPAMCWTRPSAALGRLQHPRLKVLR